jgi:RNA polymerase sigma-70 factor (ECF subfamily)
MGRLIDAHQGALRGFLRRVTQNPADADDLAQETFAIALERIALFEGRSSFRSWLFGIAWRKARDGRRAWFRAAKRDSEWLDSLGPPTRIDAAQSALLSQAMAALPEAQRAAVALCLGAGLSHTEVAQVLSTPVGTVKSHVARGRARLRDILGLTTENSDDE